MLRVRLVAGVKIQSFAKTNIDLNKSWWDAKKEQTKKFTPVEEAERIDTSVTEMRNVIREAFRRDYGKVEITSEWLDSIVNPHVEIKSVEQVKVKTFFDYWDEFIEYKKDIVDRRKDAYRSLRGKLQRFEAVSGKPLSIDLGVKTLQDIEEFIKNEIDIVAHHPEVYSNYPNEIVRRGQNYANGNMAKIKTFVLWLNTNGHTSVNSFRKGLYEIKKDQYADPIALNEEELDLLYSADIPPYLQRYRDMFALHCYIGARVEDFVKLKRENVDKDGVLMYIATKGIKNSQRTLYVPLCERALEIINRYNEPVRLFPFMNISGADGYNKNIKVVLRCIGIDRKVITLNTITGEKEIKPLCDVATSHTARKTFVSCMLNRAGGNAITLSPMTGHVENSKAITRYASVQLGTLKKLVEKAFE